MRPIPARIRAALACCVIAVLGVAAPSTAVGQGMVIGPRPPGFPVCPPPQGCAMDGPCPQPCGWAFAGVVRTSTQVRAELADRVLRYEVTETFTNRGPRLAEADYLFPLPAGAAFQDLALSINGELVRGEVLDATQARSVYEEIVRKQRDPALVEYLGSGLLRARIFPIAAGEEKTVVVRFQTVAPREGDALRIDYTGPGGLRERPPWVRPVVMLNRNSGPDDQQHSADAGSSYNFTLTYHAGDGYGTPYSPTSALTTERLGNDLKVRVDGGGRDITVLLPTPRSTGVAVSMLPYAPGDGPGFALITLSPPVLRGHSTPRDVTFVLDVSGSMSGHKIEQARAAGRQLLATLSPQDRFRLIDFSTDVRTFRDDFEFATPEHLREANHYLDELEAQGATNIDGALTAALKAPPSEDEGQAGDGGPSTPRESGAAGRLPLVLFITDGEPTVGERSPEVLVTRAVAQLGSARLFTFGLGADVNTSLLEQLALRGRGTAQFVRPDESVERAVSLVARRLTDPVVTDLAVHADGVRLEQMLPATMVDLFAGQDLVLLARYLESGTTRLRFTGRTAAGPISWETTVTFPARERANPFVARLWATQRVGYLEAQRHASGGSEELDAELKSLGERYGIPTEFTSYLVQEPTLAMRAGGMAGGIGMQRDRKDGSMQTGPAIVPQSAAPMAQLNAAKAASEQRAVTSLAAADASNMAGVAGGAPAASGIRRAGDRTFVLRDSVWTDTRFKSGGPVIRVQVFSPAYFDLLQSVPELRDAFAIGDRVLVTGRQLSIEVTPSGTTQLAAADANAVRTGW